MRPVFYVPPAISKWLSGSAGVARTPLFSVRVERREGSYVGLGDEENQEVDRPFHPKIARRIPFLDMRLCNNAMCTHGALFGRGPGFPIRSGARGTTTGRVFVVCVGWRWQSKKKVSFFDRGSTFHLPRESHGAQKRRWSARGNGRNVYFSKRGESGRPKT